MNRCQVLIVEDELPAQASLRNAIERNFDDLEVVGVLDSVKDTVAWLSCPDHRADILFLDVELSDGLCFDIFSQIEVKSKVIITTAYDNYAVKAFRINTIDYLLKPIDPEELKAAVARCRETPAGEKALENIDLEQLKKMLGGRTAPYRERFVIRIGDHIAIVKAQEAAYFHTANKGAYVTTTDGRTLVMDPSLDAISEDLDPRRFFRISRHCTVAVDAIADITRHVSGRLRLQLTPAADFEVFVSRSRTNDFLEWLGGK